MILHDPQSLFYLTKVPKLRCKVEKKTARGTVLCYSVHQIGNYELHSGSKVHFTMNEFQSARHASL
jgi:hypothetical protein